MELLKRKFLKRIPVCLLSAVILSVSAGDRFIVSDDIRTVEATAAVPVADGSVESLMALLDILINASAVGGASEYVANYEDDTALLDAFVDFMWSAYPGGAPAEADATFYLEDGTVVTAAQILDGVEDGTVTLPNEQQWGQYRVGFGDDFASILEAWEGRGGGSGSGSSQEPEEPGFSKLEALGISAGFMAVVGDFFTALYNDEIEGLSSTTYYADDVLGKDIKEQWSGSQYVYKVACAVDRYYQNGNYNFTQVYYRNFSLGNYANERLAGYIQDDNVNFLAGNAASVYALKQYVYSSADMQDYTNYSHTTQTAVYGLPYSVNTSTEKMNFFTCNFPIFQSDSAARNYLQTGEGYKNALNYKPVIYDYPALTANIPAAFSPWTKSRISPAALQKTYAGVKNAYETQIKPQVDTSAEPDTKANTDTYIDTVTGVVADTVVQPGTGTGTDPAPQPDPDPTKPGTGTETSPDEDVDRYKRDLRMVFPFCLPFDLIALLDALDAEPVTPCFDYPFVVEALNIDMVVKIDLSFLDGVAEMMRLFETIGFIITLITVTHKMIKW